MSIYVCYIGFKNLLWGQSFGGQLSFGGSCPGAVFGGGGGGSCPEDSCPTNAYYTKLI